jgi:hypothetical protein
MDYLPSVTLARLVCHWDRIKFLYPNRTRQPLSTSIFDLWRVRAIALAGELRYSADLGNETLGILSTAFGVGWLQQVTEKRTKGSPFPFREHPIGDALHISAAPQVVALLELAHYLKFAASSSAFDQIVHNLKAQHESTLLQLAFANRFAVGGASNVTLEPPVSGSRVGDIAFDLVGRRYVAECYIPRVATAGRSSSETQWLVQQAVESVKALDLVFSLAVELNEPLTVEGRKLLVRAISVMANKLAEQAYSRGISPEPLLEVLGPGTISVAISKAVGPDDQSILVLHADFPAPRDVEPDVIVRTQWALASEALRAQDQVIRADYGTHIAVWYSARERNLTSLKQDLNDPLARLAKKLKQKLAQTKLEGGSRRLLIVETWLVYEIERATDDDLREFRRRLFEDHSDVAGILLAHRRWNDAVQRTTYRTRMLLPAEPDLAFVTWMDRIRAEAAIRGFP